MISRIRQRWAQSAPCDFAAFALLLKLGLCIPYNPCPASTGFSSDPVAPVSCQVAPLQVAIHPSWPSPSVGVPFVCPFLGLCLHFLFRLRPLRRAAGGMALMLPSTVPRQPCSVALTPPCRARLGLPIGPRCCWRILSPLPRSGRPFHLLCLARRLSLRPALCWLAIGPLR